MLANSADPDETLVTSRLYSSGSTLFAKVSNAAFRVARVKSVVAMFECSAAQDQPAHPSSVIRVYTVHYSHRNTPHLSCDDVAGH